MKIFRKRLCLPASLVFIFSQVHAEFLTIDNIDYPNLINFNQLPIYMGEPGPISIGNALNENISASISDSSQNEFWSHLSGWGFNSNGSWQNPKTFLAMSASPGPMMITFNDRLISQVVIFMNYDPFHIDAVISVMDGNMLVLESYNINELAPISTPGRVNDGAYRGISRPIADIKHLVISGPYIAIDNIIFSDYTDLIFKDDFE